VGSSTFQPFGASFTSGSRCPVPSVLFSRCRRRQRRGAPASHLVDPERYKVQSRFSHRL